MQDILKQEGHGYRRWTVAHCEMHRPFRVVEYGLGDHAFCPPEVCYAIDIRNFGIIL